MTLPASRDRGGQRSPLVLIAAGDSSAPISGPLRDIEPITLEIAAGGQDLAEWTEIVDRYHPRSLRAPIGCHLAYFVMITATRLMTSVIDQQINGDDDGDDCVKGREPRKRVNFKSAIAAMLRNLEALALTRADAVAKTIARMVENIASLWQSERPGRSYPRILVKPKSKWPRKGKVAQAHKSSNSINAKKRPKKAETNHVPLRQ